MLFAFLTDRDGSGVFVLRLIILTLVFPMIAAIGAQFDHTVIMEDGSGHGFLQHAGFLVLFASSPAVILISFMLLDRSASVITNPRFTGEVRNPARLNSFQRRLVSRMSFRHKSSKITLTAASFIGAAFLLINAHTTSDPRIVYGADVWDAKIHVYGFYAAKVFLAYQWMYLYPIVVTVALSSIYVICSIVARVTKTSAAVELPAYAPDGCGGFRSLGELMLGVVYLDVPFFLVLLALGHTHQSFYWTLELGTAILIVGVIVEMFLPFVQLHGILTKAKRAKLIELQNAIEKLWEQRPAHGRSNELALLATNALYERTSRVSTWPYVAGDTIRIALSFLPVVTTIVRLAS
jgi:hypothetical protein